MGTEPKDFFLIKFAESPAPWWYLLEARLIVGPGGRVTSVEVWNGTSRFVRLEVFYEASAAGRQPIDVNMDAGENEAAMTLMEAVALNHLVSPRDGLISQAGIFPIGAGKKAIPVDADGLSPFAINLLHPYRIEVVGLGLPYQQGADAPSWYSNNFTGDFGLTLSHWERLTGLTVFFQFVLPIFSVVLGDLKQPRIANAFLQAVLMVWGFYVANSHITAAATLLYPLVQQLRDFLRRTLAELESMDRTQALIIWALKESLGDGLTRFIARADQFLMLLRAAGTEIELLFSWYSLTQVKTVHNILVIPQTAISAAPVSVSVMKPVGLNLALRWKTLPAQGGNSASAASTPRPRRSSGAARSSATP